MTEQMVTSEEFNNGSLFAGAVQKIATESVILKGGRAYLRGTVLGLIDAESKATVVDSTKSDGSQRPYGILTDNVDATSGDTNAVVYLTGEFNQAALTFGGTDTAAKHKRALREMGIFLKTTVKA